MCACGAARGLGKGAATKRGQQAAAKHADAPINQPKRPRICCLDSSCSRLGRARDGRQQGGACLPLGPGVVHQGAALHASQSTPGVSKPKHQAHIFLKGKITGKSSARGKATPHPVRKRDGANERNPARAARWCVGPCHLSVQTCGLCVGGWCVVAISQIQCRGGFSNLLAGRKVCFFWGGGLAACLPHAAPARPAISGSHLHPHGWRKRVGVAAPAISAKKLRTHPIRGHMPLLLTLYQISAHTSVQASKSKPLLEPANASD